MVYAIESIYGFSMFSPCALLCPLPNYKTCIEIIFNALDLINHTSVRTLTLEMSWSAVYTKGRYRIRGGWWKGGLVPIKQNQVGQNLF